MHRRHFLQVAVATGVALGADRSGLAQKTVAEPAFWKLAPTPPMGWNSYDYYGATVTEAEFLANAQYQQRHLLPSGYQYAVVDYLWFDPSQATPPIAHHGPLAMDAFGRLLPAVNKFPSARHGAGFKPLADRTTALGLKFGIHIMRGIPRQAVAANTPIFGTHFTPRTGG